MNRSKRKRNSEKTRFGPLAKIAPITALRIESRGILGSPRSRSSILELPGVNLFALCS
jgi:hypothetical protein